MPWNSLVPDLMLMLVTPPWVCPNCASKVAVWTLNSCTMSVGRHIGGRHLVGIGARRGGGAVDGDIVEQAAGAAHGEVDDVGGFERAVQADAAVEGHAGGKADQEEGVAVRQRQVRDALGIDHGSERSGSRHSAAAVSVLTVTDCSEAPISRAKLTSRRSATRTSTSLAQGLLEAAAPPPQSDTTRAKAGAPGKCPRHLW